MALLLPGGCASFSVSPSRTARSSRRTAIFATLSPPRRDTVNWVEATSSFFQNDSRPIMLYDDYDILDVLRLLWLQKGLLNRNPGRLDTFGVCNLCNGGVRFVRDIDQNRRIRYEALQSEAGKNLLRRSGRAPDDISSVVLVEKDRSYIKSDAVLKIMEYVDLPFPQLAFFLQFVPQFARDFVYDNIANNRYTIFGRSDSCELYDN